MFPLLWIFRSENWPCANEIFLDIFLFICHVNITYYKSPKAISFLSCECFQMKIDHAWMKLSWTFSFFSISIALLSRIFAFFVKNRQNMLYKHLGIQFRYSPYLELFKITSFSFKFIIGVFNDRWLRIL